MSLKSSGLLLVGSLLWAIAGISAARKVSDFAGTWIMNYQGQPVLKLTLSAEGGRLTGTLTRPKDLVIDSDGDVTSIGPDLSVQVVQAAKLKQEQLEIRIEGDGFVMVLQGPERASLVMQGIRPFLLERVADGQAVTFATRLTEPDYPAEIVELRLRLRAMVKEDQDARLNFADARIEATDVKNRPLVIAIFERYGWITRSLAGKEASNNFWLLVQHQTPEIQKRLLPALEKAARAGDASMSNYAYLYDRVQVRLGKLQRWGTYITCKKRKPVLYPVEDPDGLDARREELSMPPIREYLKMDYLVKMCAKSR